MANFQYQGSTLSASLDSLADEEAVNIELGDPVIGPVDVTFTITDATSVSDATGPWPDYSMTFTEALEDPLEVTASSSAGSKTLWVRPKPHGGLPGGSPV